VIDTRTTSDAQNPATRKINISGLHAFQTK